MRDPGVILKYMHEPVASVAVQMNLLEKLTMKKHFMNASLAMRL